MSVGERIRERRKVIGYTQKELAEKSGIATVSVQQYERGVRQPRLEQLRRIALALDTTVSELVEPGYWSTVSKEEAAEAWGGSSAQSETVSVPQRRISATLEQLSPAGQVKVADYAEDILPRYRAQERPQASPADSAGQDTTPALEGAEGPYNQAEPIVQKEGGEEG